MVQSADRSADLCIWGQERNTNTKNVRYGGEKSGTRYVAVDRSCARERRAECYLGSIEGLEGRNEGVSGVKMILLED